MLEGQQVNINLKQKVAKKRPKLSISLLSIDSIENDDLKCSSNSLKFFDTPESTYDNSPDYSQKLFDNYHQFDNFYDISTKKCQRNTQEDRFAIDIQVDSLKNKVDCFFGIYDGHNGSQVSDFLKDNLHYAIKYNTNYQSNILEAIQQTFISIDQQIIHEKKLKGGSTSLFCIIQDIKSLVIGNLGDSISIILRKNNFIVRLNHEHKVSNEKEALLAKGAVILDRGKIERIDGKLALSRSFGDSEFKNIINCEPELIQYNIQSDDEFLLLGTDGFWDYIKPEEVGFMIHQYVQEKNTIEGLSYYLINKASDTQKLTCKSDNMTLIVVDISQITVFIQKHTDLKNLTFILPEIKN